MTLLDLNVWGKGQAEDHTAPAADAITEDISENAGMSDMTLPAYVPAEDVVQESAEPEDNAQKQSLQTEIAETSDETVDTAEVAEDQETEEVSMFRKTLLQDMDTANYYELVEWCRSLNLPENGDAAALKNSLMEYYKVQEEKKPDKKGDTIIIRSSDKTRYFSIEQMDQNYIIITGNVVLEVNEEDKDIKHQIQADKLIYNQNKQLMTADGNVIYTKTSEGKDEKFFGDKLTFNMENWSGVFFAGISEKTMTMNEKEVKFYYSGEKIHRISKEVSIMENADITSQQDADTSYYRLHAKKIWLLAPGEWGVSNAVLYVGNIPMFYFPFFFKPGDRFVMRPSVGYQEQKGHFIQTTTYLYGEPSAADSENLSFLAASDAEDRLYEKELNGLYLRRTDVKKANPDDSSFVKIMLDLYYNLGFYGAVQGDLKGNSYFNDTKFYLGIGKTRNVYNESGFFTPFYEYEDGSQEDHWHRGYLGNKRLPFRFGAELDTGFDYKIFRSTLAFDIYSDPYLLRDFENRSESMNWGKLLGMEDNTEDDVDDYTGVRDRLYWFFHTELNPDFGNVNKYLSFKLTKMDFYMNWVNKERDITGMKGLDPSLPGYIDPSYSTDFFFPESTFYYPENYVLPDMSFTVSGTIFDTVYNKDTNYQRQEKKKEKALAKAEKQMLRKEDEGETDASAEEADAETGEDEPAAPHSVSDSIAALDSDSDRLKSIMKKPFADDKKDDGDKKRETKVLRVPDAAEDEP
ncbi:MAG: hypothetical protein MJ215_07690, partial [Spirochaetia bacterium]|nr:hypothetical protein [Spirochaetia bacterium]